MHGLRADRRWRRVATPGWIAAHALALAFVTACLLLGRWQIGRAAEGNLLSYGYAVQWPAFAAFAVWVWISEMRKTLRQSGPAAADAPDGAEPDTSDQTVRSQPPPSRPRRPRNEAAYDDSDDPALAAYNHYLAWLNAHPNATPADYPGPPARKELTS
ncbi:MAG: hypothetical protein IRY85_01250 [Micromonosporaceae bacterium]|nr:hypothetical protein [Micromonosporaceae bacterium]